MRIENDAAGRVPIHNESCNSSGNEYGPGATVGGCGRGEATRDVYLRAAAVRHLAADVADMVRLLRWRQRICKTIVS